MCNLKQQFLLKQEDRTLFVKSEWQKEPTSAIYLAYRWLLTLYLTITWMVMQVIAKNANGVKYSFKMLIYLTYWGYTACVLQSILCTLMVTYWYLRYNEGNDLSILKIYRFYWIFNVTSTDLAFVITLTYWIFVRPRETGTISIANVMAHVINSICMLSELLITAHPVQLLHFYLPILFAFIYCIFTYVYFLFGGTDIYGENSIYPILKWDEKPLQSLMVCFFVMLAIVVIHLLTYAIYRGRNALSTKLLRKRNENESNAA